jgi:hypothetical protein
MPTKALLGEWNSWKRGGAENSGFRSPYPWLAVDIWDWAVKTLVAGVSA